ncbi:hypothetical protein EDB85DRAFT_2274671 [Lactarius pseudohatsudake]|nr:hypothetical protein EDB85DRAFT_2274671 [Lactarius pseudohatsudake]
MFGPEEADEPTERKGSVEVVVLRVLFLGILTRHQLWYSGRNAVHLGEMRELRERRESGSDAVSVFSCGGHWAERVATYGTSKSLSSPRSLSGEVGRGAPSAVPMRKGRSNAFFSLATFFQAESGEARSARKVDRTWGLEHALADQRGRAMLGLFVNCERVRAWGSMFGGKLGHDNGGAVGRQITTGSRMGSWCSDWRERMCGMRKSKTGDARCHS